jgi:hypothetical protein
MKLSTVLRATVLCLAIAVAACVRIPCPDGGNTCGPPAPGGGGGGGGAM